MNNNICVPPPLTNSMLPPGPADSPRPHGGSSGDPMQLGRPPPQGLRTAPGRTAAAAVAHSSNTYYMYLAICQFKLNKGDIHM